MIRVRALRGVCIGVDRHLKPGDVAELEHATVQFLSSIGAVERVPEEVPAPIAAPEPEKVPTAAPASTDQAAEAVAPKAARKAAAVSQ